ncbi:hypothetical protein MFUL124B02_25690 [Myxococcus fulvus 124B02]|nr:hypothetical protein MFUL124B02_25690 [Myxococcus fulvus 124B02]
MTMVPERSGEPQARQTVASRGFSVSQRGQYSIASMGLGGFYQGWSAVARIARGLLITRATW